MPLSEQDEAELKAAHRLYGRDTLVGRELFRIYNKGKVEYAPEVRILTRPSDPAAEHKALQRERVESRAGRLVRARQEAARLSQPRASPKPRADPLARLGRGRRRAEAIAREMEDERRAEGAPLSRKYESRDSQIAQLQSKLSGNDVQASPQPLAPAAAPSSSKAKAAEAEVRLFNQIQDEIEARRRFLQEMRDLGSADPYEEPLRREIAERVRELKVVHQRICVAEEAAEAEATEATHERARADA